MSDYGKRMYADLMELTEKDASFFFKDFKLEGKTYRIFNYRLASWSSFANPNALNCRGTMFEVSDGAFEKLSCLPPEKFFNYEEGGVDHESGVLGDKMDKMDGSLISSYVHDGVLYLKSKGSLFSEQAIAAMKFLGKDENEGFKRDLEKLAELGYTANLEYTSPDNRIVIPYQEEALTLLSARSMNDGSTLYASKLAKVLNDSGHVESVKRLVRFSDMRGSGKSHKDFVEETRAEQQGEGYVVEIEMPDGISYLVKVKNLKYVALHQTKDSVNSPKRLFEAVLNEGSDDLRSMFADDPYVLGKIAEMENKVLPKYNSIIADVEGFVDENGSLSRKDFAIKAQSERPELMGLLMTEYLDRKVETGEIVPKEDSNGNPIRRKPAYKDFAIKFRKEIFGIGDEDPELDEDGNEIGDGGNSPRPIKV